MLCLAIKSFEKALEASICAAAFEHPKHLMPAAFRTSATPFARGSSGPTTTRSTCNNHTFRRFTCAIIPRAYSATRLAKQVRGR